MKTLQYIACKLSALVNKHCYTIITWLILLLSKTLLAQILNCATTKESRYIPDIKFPNTYIHAYIYSSEYERSLNAPNPKNRFRNGSSYFNSQQKDEQTLEESQVRCEIFASWIGKCRYDLVLCGVALPIKQQNIGNGKAFKNAFGFWGFAWI